MGKNGSYLDHVEGEIAGISDPKFLYHLHNGLLLALKEQGLIHEMLYRQAEAALSKQYLRELRP